MATVTQYLENKPGYSGYNKKYYIELTYYEELPSDYITTNKTNVTMVGKIIGTGNYTYHGYNNYGTLKINGNAVANGSNSDYVNSDGNTIVSGTFEVEHNADGSKSITVGFDFSTGYPKINGGSVSTTMVLTTIPRSSPVSVSDNPILGGTAVTITCARPSGTSFTHLLRVKDGSTIIQTLNNGEKVATTLSWSPSLEDYASLITSGDENGCKKAFTLECLTYNGNTHIGTKTCAVTLIVPNNANTKPTISTVTLSEGRPATQAGHDGVPSNWGCYVQKQSKLNIVINGSMKYGATLKGATTEIDGKIITGSLTDLLDNAGTGLIASSTVTDSRGFTSAAKTATYDVVAYAPPQITKFTAERCDSNGIPRDDGTYLLYTFVGSISPVNNKNSKLFRIGYKVKNSYSDYTYVTVVNNAYVVNKTTAEILPGVTLDPTKEYEIVFEAQDYFHYSEPIQKKAVIAIGADLLNFASNGKSIGIGQLSTAIGSEKKLEIGMDTYINGALYIDGEKMIWFEEE